MRNEKITIKPNYSKIRNELHFEVQLNTRARVYENKKRYNRKKLKPISYE